MSRWCVKRLRQKRGTSVQKKPRCKFCAPRSHVQSQVETFRPWSHAGLNVQTCLASQTASPSIYATDSRTPPDTTHQDMNSSDHGESYFAMLMLCGITMQNNMLRGESSNHAGDTKKGGHNCGHDWGETGGPRGKEIHD